MKSYFKITASQQKNTEDQPYLLLQHGSGLSGYILYNPKQRYVIKSELWEIKDEDPWSEIEDLVRQEISSVLPISKTIFINYHSGYFAIPDEIYKSEKLNHWIDLLGGQNPMEKKIISSPADQHMIVVHPIKTKDYENITLTYPEVSIYALQEFAHISNEYNTDTLNITFFNKNIFISLYINGFIQLNQAYAYQTSEDVLYTLLKITDQFSIDRNKLMLIPEGFIDASSTLYQLLDQYFLNIYNPDKILTRYPEDTTSLSPYILRHIDRILTCVS